MNELMDGMTVELPDSKISVSIKDITGFNWSNFKPKELNFQSVIAECDSKSEDVIKFSLSNLMGSIVDLNLTHGDRDYIRSLIRKRTGYEPVVEFSSDVFSTPVVHTMDRGSDEVQVAETTVTEDKVGVKGQDELDTILSKFGTGEKAKDEEVSRIMNDLDSKKTTTIESEEEQKYDIDSILSQHGTGEKANDEEVNRIMNDLDSKKNGDVVVQTESKLSDYRTDPSQVIDEQVQEVNTAISEPSITEQPSLLERLQKINSEGSIFVDEERITDKNLNVRNAISLRKLNDNKLKPQQVNTSSCRLLDLKLPEFNALKHACSSWIRTNVVEKVSSFFIKNNNKLNSRYNKIHDVNVEQSSIAELSEEQIEVIRQGTKGVKYSYESNISDERAEKYDKLVELREQLINSTMSVENDDEYEHTHARVA